MSFRDSRFGEVKVPLAWTAAVALIVAGIVAVALIMSDRRETFEAEAYGPARKAADGVLAPVGEVVSAPIRWIGAGVNGVRGYFFAVSENRRLKRELAEARQWKNVAVAVQDVNERYRQLLQLRTDPPIPMVSARIVADSRGPFANTRLANAGKEAAVKVGNPVMSEEGLVGRVIGVTTGASRILLLTDVASRTPVMVDRTNARAILTGDGSGHPQLAYLRGRDPVKVGDRILTSGDGGVFPRGLPVGTAVRGLDGAWRVALDSDRDAIDFVRILQFVDFSQLVNEAELAASDRPPPPVAPPVAAPTGPAIPSRPAGAPAATTPPTKTATTPATKAPATPAPKTTTPPPKTTTPAVKTPAPPVPAAKPPSQPAGTPQ